MVQFDPENGESVEATVAQEEAGARVDVYLARFLPKQSRSFLQKLIDSRLVEVEGEAVKASRKMAAGERVTVFLPEPVALEARPEPLPLVILYEDADLIVIDKPPGMVVHPSPGHESGSLVNGLLHHCRDLSGIGGVLRPGIVHRLDRDTSGVIVAAKNDSAHQHLAAQFKERTTQKVYRALTHGAPVPPSGTVEGAIGRHPARRALMAVVRSGGRAAVTGYETLAEWGPYACIECRPKTGRTHQIRVHLSHIGCPILCDTYYGRETALTVSDLTGQGRGQAGAEGSRVVLSRQALHAFRLSFLHPRTEERMEFEASMPEDLAAATALLRTRIHGDDVGS